MGSGIGTLNEGALHAGLKQWLARPGDRFEQPFHGYVIDMVRGDLFIEIQTGGFSPLATKLAHLLEHHRVRLVVPIARTRCIVRMSEDGARLSQRRSTKHGRIEDIFARLVSIPSLIGHARFELELLEIAETERRVFQRGKAWRRRGWVVEGRDLVDVLERNLIRDPADLAALLPPSLPAQFTTADIERRSGIALSTAQQMVYCLRAVGALERVGKHGNAHVYRRLC
jgi:hypothetical protein